MVAIMIGIEILKPVKVSIFHDTQKLKKVSQKESLKDYRKDVSNNAAEQGLVFSLRSKASLLVIWIKIE